MAKTKKKILADPNKRAKAIVGIATREKDPVSDEIKAAAAALGSKGGLKGGPARAKKLTQSRRLEIEKKAAPHGGS